MTFTTELEARRYMEELDRIGVRYSYWHRSVCEHIVTLLSPSMADVCADINAVYC